jgi:hypothetical protein
MGLGSGIRDPGSGIRKNLFRIPDPGVNKAPDPGSGSTTVTGTVQCRTMYTVPLPQFLYFLKERFVNHFNFYL